jgi:phosphoribosylaminoimidazole-succinocarboxamide synthase
VDPVTAQRLASQDLKPEFFAFRWLTLLLSQEFALPDVQRIWDSLLSDQSRHNFLVDLCAAMVVLVRDDILRNDFGENMKLLQVIRRPHDMRLSLYNILFQDVH